ncbi:MAG: hypothetical protein AABZ74_06385 [Cyanobacteriota bacterium]
MKKVIYSGICSLFLFSCIVQVNNEPIKNRNDSKEFSFSEPKNKFIKPLQIPELTLKNQDNIYLGSISKLNADFKDENGTISNDIIWKSSDEKIGKIEKDNFLKALSIGKIKITATSRKYQNISKSFDLIIKEKEIKSITVRSKKDGYIIAKTDEPKKQFNFDSRIESQDSFISEVEYKDGSKTEEVVWENNSNNIISVQNGIVKGIVYGSSDISIHPSNNKSQKVVFRANFVNNLIMLVPKYNDYYDYNSSYNNDIDSIEDVSEKSIFRGQIFDNYGISVDNAIVNAKSISPFVSWVGEPQKTQGGSYVFRNAPVGVKIEIIVRKDGLTTRVRTEVLKSSISGNPKANVFDFGRGNDINGTDPNNLYAMQVL